MSARPTRRSVARRTACVAAAGAMVLTGVVAIPAQADTPSTSRTGLTSRHSGVLSARLAQLATPRLQSASVTAQARALSLPVSGGGALSTDDSGRVTVLVNLTSTSTATIDRLKALGTVLNVSAAMSRATLQIDPSDLTSLAATAGVTYADVVLAPQLASTPNASTFSLSRTKTAAGKVVCNPVKSESDVQLRAALARANSKVNGRGVPIGVLSDSYNTSTGTSIHAAQDVKAGELPGAANPCGYRSPVKVYSDGDDGSDEGRAMMQSIHDLAPGSPLMFQTANGGPDVFAAHIVKLAQYGAKVIVDDVSYLDEPFFQSGVVDQAIKTVTSPPYNVSYFSAVGNDNIIYKGHNVASWETPIAQQTACPAGLNFDDVSYTDCVNFSPSATATPAGLDSGYNLTVGGYGQITIDLQWAQPFGSTLDDFDLALVDKTTNEVLSYSDDPQSSTSEPVEALRWSNNSAAPRNVRVVIAHYTGPGLGWPRMKMVFVQSYGLTNFEYPQSAGPNVVGPTIFGHGGGPNTISVAAVPFNNSRSPEFYSSRGPVTHYFGPVTGSTPAAALSPPQVINAPDLTATDGNATSFFGDPVHGIYRFFGTSDAAPNAAAVAALLKSLHPTISAAHVQLILQANAAPVGIQPKTTVGAGLVDALAALAGTRQLGRPAAPTAIKIKPGKGSVTLHFTAPTNTGHLRIIKYTATCSSTAPKSATRSVAFAGGAVKVVGLTRGRAYRCTITATNVLGSQRSVVSHAFKA